MKASLATAIGAGFTVHDVILDKPIGREVLVDVKASGLCHSDLHEMEHDHGFVFPGVGGHEISGVVAEVGPEVTGMKPGDHVVACLVPYCGVCAECLSGRSTLCTNSESVLRGEGEKPRVTLPDGTPVDQWNFIGGFAEQTLVHENQLAVVSKDIPFPQASVIGCAVVTGAGAVINTAHVRPGETVAVLGMGGIGLNAISAARLAGALHIIAVDIDDAKLETAKKFGATHTINSAKTDLREAVLEITGTGVHHAFEAIGLAVTQAQLLEIIRQGGTAYLIGITPPGTQLEVDSSLDALFQQRKVHAVLMGSTNTKRDIPMYAELYLQGRFELDTLISQEIGIDDIDECYEQLRRGEVIRSVVTSF